MPINPKIVEALLQAKAMKGGGALGPAPPGAGGLVGALGGGPGAGMPFGAPGAFAAPGEDAAPPKQVPKWPDFSAWWKQEGEFELADIVEQWRFDHPRNTEAKDPGDSGDYWRTNRDMWDDTIYQRVALDAHRLFQAGRAGQDAKQDAFWKYGEPLRRLLRKAYAAGRNISGFPEMRNLGAAR